MKTRYIWMSAMVLTLSLLGQVAAYRLQRPTLMLHASWAFVPKSFADAKEAGKLIVLADVLKVERGEDMVVPAKGELNGEDRIPTQKITLKVVKGYRGAEEGAQLLLFQTGGLLLPAAPKEGEKAPATDIAQMVLEGDPIYKRGHRYLLLLNEGPDKMHQTIAPEGRYRLIGDKFSAMVRNPVTSEISGKTLAEVERLLGQ